MLILHLIEYSTYILCMPFIFLVESETMPAQTEIPEITLSNEKGMVYRGLLGSYCWNGICEDRQLSPNTIKSPKIQLQNHSIITFDMKGNVKAEKLHATIFDVQKFPSGIILDREIIENKLSIDIPPGDYILTVMAVWQGKGDVSYAFPIEVTAKNADNNIT
jgi:hypothetical protein